MKILATILFALTVFSGLNYSQTCNPPAIQFNSKQDIIFTPEQEMYLGDAIFEKVKSTYGGVDDPEISAYLNRLGERLGRHLPNTGIKFRFMVSDYPSTNAFALPGGIIMVTRKMVNFAKTEDELAAIVAHELGHATVRHGAIDFSRLFREVLNVTSLGDRNDVIDKYNQLIDRWNTKTVRTAENHQDKKQLEADEIGMHALVASGYDGSQFTQIWIRLTKARKRSGFAEFFSTSSPADVRLKEMLNQLKAMPEKCREQKPVGATKEFEDWRAMVQSYDNRPKIESVPGLMTRKELIPIRSDVEYLRFSPNGEFIVSQDTSTITVLKRDPFLVLFQIPAEDSRPAEFSPDSTEIVSVTRDLRVQRWNIAQRRLVADHEVSLPGGVWQSRVSPNGEVIATYQFNGDLIIYDIKTGNELFRKKKFYLPYLRELLIWRIAWEYSDDNELVLLAMKFSPDGKYLLAGREFSSGYSMNNEESIVISIADGKEVKIGDNVKDLIKSGFGFLSSDKMIGRTSNDLRTGGIFSFPDGKRLDQFELGGILFTKSGMGDYVVVRPVSGAAVGVYDLKQKRYVFAGKKSALDVTNETVVAERKNGELALYTIGQREPFATVELPKSKFGGLRTVAFSENGEWLVASDKSRGAVWNLKTGDRRFHLRSFRGSFIADDGKIYADFPAIGTTPRSIAAMDLTAGNVSAGTEISDRSVRQHGRYLVVRRPLKTENEKEEKENATTLYSEEVVDRGVDYKRTVTEVRDAQTGATLWTRAFANETPRYFISISQNSMAFMWRLDTVAASEIIKQNPRLGQKVPSITGRERDYLIEIVDPMTGAVRNHFLLETGEGSFTAQYITVAGDYLVVDDNQSRQMVYSVSSGALLRRFFGTYGMMNEKKGLIAIENVEGRVSVNEISSGRQIGKLEFRNGIVTMRFSNDGEKLYVLTNDQVAYSFDIGKMASESNASGKE